LIGILNRNIPENLVDAFNSIYNIINSLDVCNLINAALSLVIDAFNSLTEKIGLSVLNVDNKLLPYYEEFLAVENSIQNTKKLLAECVPPKPIESASDKNTKDEILRDACEFALYNIGKIPYFITADILKFLKEKIIELILQFVMSLVIEFLNSLIKQLNSLCVDKDKTSPAITTAPLKKPLLKAPSDALDDLAEKCSITGLLSANPNITRTQIYNVVRAIYKLTKITNTDFDSYFSGITSTLNSQEIINLFSDNVDDIQYALMKNFTNNKQYVKFTFLFSNKTIFKSFFSFLSRYVDLTPCYEQLAKDRTESDYCFTGQDILDIPPEELLSKANDLSKEVSDLCSLLKPDSANQAVAGAVSAAVSLENEAKKAISLGAYSIIENYYNSFEQLKKQLTDSYNSIFLLNKTIHDLNFISLSSFISLKTTSGDVIVPQIVYFDQEESAIKYTQLGKDYVSSKLARFDNDDGTNKNVLVTFTPLEDAQFEVNNQKISFSSKYSIDGESTQKQIIPATFSALIKDTKKTELVPKTSKKDFTKDSPKVLDIFFDPTRFIKGSKDPKNYYYVYDNLLSNSEKNSAAEIESLKKYKDIKIELENFLKVGGV
jgi:hypothetical protein